MTIEIQELIIQVQVEKNPKQHNSKYVDIKQQNIMVNQVTKRVLECLRDERGDWL